MNKPWLETNLDTMHNMSANFLRACSKIMTDNKTEISKILNSYPEQYVCINHLATLGKFLTDSDYIPRMPDNQEKNSYYNGVKNTVQAFTYDKVNRIINSFDKLSTGNPKAIKIRMSEFNYMERQALIFMAQLQGWKMNFPNKINYFNDNTEYLFIRDRAMKAKDLIRDTLFKIFYYYNITANNRQDVLDLVRYKNSQSSETSPFGFYLLINEGDINLVNKKGTVINTFIDNTKLTLDKNLYSF